MRSALAAGWSWINNRVFTPLKNGLNSLWNWFGVVVRGIGKTWDFLKETVAAPVRWVVNTVIRDKLMGAWNAVAAKVKLQPFQFKGFEGGGWTGPGSKFRPAGVVHADEFVLQKRSRRKLERRAPGGLDFMNRTGEWPGYHAGGRVYDSERPGPRMGGRTSPIHGQAPSDQGVWRQMVTWIKANMPGVRVTSG